MNSSYRIALICGFVPLIVGSSIFLLWLVTRWPSLMFAGLLTIYGGVAFILIGAAFLAQFFWSASRAAKLSRKQLWFSTLICAALLLSNFVVAGAIVVTAYTVETRYVVIIHNNSQQPINGAQVSGGGCEADFGIIPAGGTIQRAFWVQGDGELTFRAQDGVSKGPKTIDGYVTNGMGGQAVITVNPDGTLSVAHPSD